MPHVTFVKKARKDNPVAKKGESYYWWAFMVGGRGGSPSDKRRAPKRRSAVARSLAHPLFRPRRVPDRRRKLLQAAREADHGDR